MEKLGIYIHIPYCLKKCRYCDFASQPLDLAEEWPDSYAWKVCTEIEKAAAAGLPGAEDCTSDKFLVDSIFFGGGTPTCVPINNLGLILSAIAQNYRVSEDAEITVEANPETVIESKIKVLRYYGFNRISMGVQSFDDKLLTRLGRVHSAEKARAAYKIIRDAGFDNVNLDLMLGIPGQTEAVWADTLGEAIALKPEHLSFYSLQLEEGTPLYEAYKSGSEQLPTWEENRSMYHYAVKALKDAGYHHYEISNAALPGKECRHNLKYWHMEPYLGFGTSAASFIGGKRYTECKPDAEAAGGDAYGADGQSEGRETEIRSLKGDFIFTELRLVDGFELSEYTRLFGGDFLKDYEQPLAKLFEDNMLRTDGVRLAFTEKGLDFTNPVMEELLNV